MQLHGRSSHIAYNRSHMYPPTLPLLEQDLWEDALHEAVALGAGIAEGRRDEDADDAGRWERRD